MDERIDRILAKLNRTDMVVALPKTPQYQPPKTFDEFLAAEELVEWPQHLTSESAMGLDRNVIGTRDEVLLQLKDATPVDMEFITNIEDRLQNFEDKLNIYASQLISRPRTPPADIRETLGEGAFLTESAVSELASSIGIAKKKTKKGAMDVLEESRRNTVEHCFFPGFHPGELPQLPGQLEAPQLLHRVTKAQDFKPGFRTFWKKIYQSEASVAILKDAFWWHLIDRFQSVSLHCLGRGEAIYRTFSFHGINIWNYLSKHMPINNTPSMSMSKDRLFDRIADSFVALFSSINPEVKDKFLDAYSSCLAQSIFAVFLEAFPESERKFGPKFKEYLINNVYEWIAGVRPPHGQWKDWNLKRLEPKGGPKEDNQQMQLQKDVMNANNVQELKLDMEDFTRTVQKLGDGSANTAAYSPAPQLGSREPSKIKSVSKAVQLVSALPGRPNIPLSVSRQANCGTPTKLPTASHSMQTGSNMERVMFNPKGQSPLIVHFLRMKQLREKPAQPAVTDGAMVPISENKALTLAKTPRDIGLNLSTSLSELPGKRLGRMQAITDHRSDDTTYKQLIHESTKHSEQLHQEYKRICDQTNQEMKKYDRQRRELYVNINKLQQELGPPRSPKDRATPRLPVTNPVINIIEDTFNEEDETTSNY